jgi:hypothetical protein
MHYIADKAYFMGVRSAEQQNLELSSDSHTCILTSAEDIPREDHGRSMLP